MPKQKTLPGVKLAKGLDYKGKFPKDAKFVYFEPKRDGIRGVAINGKMYTRTGVRVVNAPFVEKALALIPKISKNYVLDGEFFYKNCQQTLGIVKTQTPDHKLRNKLVFYVFDIISKKEFDAKLCTTPLKRRKVNLEIALVKIHRFRSIVIGAVEKFEYKTIAPTDKVVQKEFRLALKAGHEGGMIKDPMSCYSFRKNKDWLKLKPVRESDLKILAVKIGKGKNSKRLGSLRLKGIVDGQKIDTWCGGGFKDKERELLWKMHLKGKLIGKVIEMHHEGVTKKKALRFPGFLRFHPDKN